MPRPNEAEFLESVLQGHRSAIEFCQMLFRISQTWDDLIDLDNDKVSKEKINQAFWEALIGLHENVFFLQHSHELVPLMRQYIMDWLDANTLELGTDHEINIAFVLRDGIGAMVAHCAYLIGGYKWMRHVSAEVRRHIFEESLGAYKSQLEFKS